MASKERFQTNFENCTGSYYFVQIVPMAPVNKLATLRKQKGMTQEELAHLTNVTVRTIQRIESGESKPRTFTLKAIATALGVPLDAILVPEPQQDATPAPENSHIPDKDFLYVFCLSCFSFIVVPYVHFLLPGYLLKKKKLSSQLSVQFAQGVIRQQISWVVCFHLLLLATLVYNFLLAQYGNRGYLINYLWIVVLMYIVNFIIISYHLISLRRHSEPAINP